MRTLTRTIATLTLAAALAAPALACPLCKEAAESAVDSSAERDYNDDPMAEARAYNRSIYFMLAVPYTIFAVGGIYCYRHLRNRPLPQG
jgi:hypothetical protein